jgi:hypothetical protein
MDDNFDSHNMGDNNKGDIIYIRSTLLLPVLLARYVFGSSGTTVEPSVRTKE